MDSYNIKQPRDFGTLISDSFLYVRRYSQSLGKSILYFVVPLICLTLIFTYRYTSGLNQKIENMAAHPQNFNFEVLLGSYSSTIILALLTSAALATVVLYHIKLAANEHRDDNMITVGEIWEGIKANFVVVLALNLIVGLLSGIATLFLILPGIYVAVKLSLVVPAYILDDKSLKDSFSRSWNLVRNYWWQTFFLAVLMYILIAIIAWGIALFFSLLGYVIGFIGFSQPQATFQNINGVVSSLSNVLYALFYTCFGLHFYNLVERKEGEGLAEEIDSIA